MSDYVFTPPSRPSLPVIASQARFPIRRIYCVGRNYADHAREMGQDPSRTSPLFFDKPADAVIGAGELPYPSGTQDLHHEVELVVALGAGGVNIPASEAAANIWGYAIGNDLTRRDVQARAKKAGHPWSMAKGFDASAVCGPIHPVQTTGPLSTGRIASVVNGELRQEGDLSQMIWSVPEIISKLSEMVALAPGDLIYTGTPAGVGQLKPGDVCTLIVEGLGSLESRVTADPA